MKMRNIIILYSLFAVLATCANLLTQRLILMYGNSALHFGVAILTGTIVGLGIKYVLDKKWIFQDATKGLIYQGKQFTAYTTMGIVTTAIFWGSETIFWLIWKSDFMREAGAILGLTIGYIAKYHLDRHFVFPKPEAGATS